MERIPWLILDKCVLHKTVIVLTCEIIDKTVYETNAVTNTKHLLRSPVEKVSQQAAMATVQTNSEELIKLLNNETL